MDEGTAVLAGADAQYQLAELEMSSQDYERLKASIAKYGIWPGYEVVVDTEGHILDGHHRAKACAELGITCPTVVMPLAEEKKWDFVFLANVARRHLTIEQKRVLVVEYHRRHPEMSNREIGRLVGLHHSTVGTTLAKLASVDEEAERTPEQVADHRNMVWAETSWGYPVRSQTERLRDGVPYPRESERREMHGERFYLTSQWPNTAVEAQALINERARHDYVELVRRLGLR